MEVKCISNEGYLFYRNKALQGSDQKTVYENMQVGEIYTVYAMMYAGLELRYLVYDGDMISWRPADIFQIIDDRIPCNWHFNFRGYDEYDIVAVWGYDEIANDPIHFNDLIDMKDEAYELFYKRKKEIDDEFLEPIG